MEEIKKLRIILKLAVLLAISPFFMMAFKRNSLWVIPGLIVLALFGLSIRSSLMQKVRFKDYLFVPSSYYVGAVFLLFASILTIGFGEDIVNGNQSPILGVLFLVGLWIFGVLIIFYTYLSRKEYKRLAKNRR